MNIELSQEQIETGKRNLIILKEQRNSMSAILVREPLFINTERFKTMASIIESYNKDIKELEEMLEN